MREWKEYKLRDFADVQTGPFGSQLHASDYVSHGTPSIMPTNIGSRLEIITDSIVYVKDEDIERLAKYTVKEGDIVYSRRGDVEKCAFITKEQTNWLCGTGCLRVRITSKKLHPKFCAYYFSSPEIKSWVSNNAVGTTMPNLNSTILGQLPLVIPELPEQTAIATVLSSLDEKIDLLHRQNKTLEGLAEVVFRAWFVEGAKSEWDEAILRDIADHCKESVNPSKQPDAVFHHFSLPAFDDGKNPRPELGAEILSNKYKVVPNSIMVSKLNPRFPRIWALFGNDIPDNPICSTEFQIVLPKKPVYFSFIYYFLKSYQVTQELIGAASGTSGSHQRVNPDDIFNLSFQMPPIKLIEDFDSFTKPFFEKIKTNTQQIRTLTGVRDTLLPKVMSGEVRVEY